MKPRKLLVAVVALFCLSAGHPPAVFAVSYDPLVSEERPVAEGMGPGATVYLFFSGTEEARRSIQIGDTIVSAEGGQGDKRRSKASIRAVSFVGRVCIRGQVLEGEVRVHDRFEETGVYLLVIPEAVCGD